MSTQTATLSHAPEPAETTPADDAALWSRATLDRQLVLLGRLAEAGLEIAVALERQAKGETPKGGEGAAEVARGDIALAYARAARAVRMTIALQSRLIADFHAFEQAAARAADSAAHVAQISHITLTHTRKANARRIIRRAIWPQSEDREAFERLIDRADIWLGDETLSGDLLRPFSEIVADICRDLGLEPDWAALSQEAWAREEIAGGQRGAPLAGFEQGLNHEGAKDTKKHEGGRAMARAAGDRRRSLE